MGGVVSKSGLLVLDDWEGPAAAVIATGTFDKVDVTAFNGNVLYQVRTLEGDWRPAEGQLVRAGLFKSVPGYSEIFPPGPTAIRFKRATPGVGATVDVDVYAPDQSTR